LLSFYNVAQRSFQIQLICYYFSLAKFQPTYLMLWSFTYCIFYQHPRVDCYYAVIATRVVLYLTLSILCDMGVMRLFVHARRAGPSRCGAQCKTWARVPSEQWFYDVIVFSQPCYDRGRTQIYSAAL